MSNGPVSRREVMGRVTKLVALAAGLGVTELKRLLSAQTTAPDAVILQKSASNTIRALKTLLENTKTVFESQYGRTTPIQKMSVSQMLPKIEPILPNDPAQRQQYLKQLEAAADSCMANFGLGSMGALGETVCMDVNLCTGQGSGGCAGTNECNSQSCPDIFNCGSNDCDDQSSCDDNVEVCRKVKKSIFDVGDLTPFAADPYIGLLLKRYGVTTLQNLATQIDRTLGQRRMRVK